ncbi:MAG: methyltransferase domain-containing protein [Actinomycetota bacterium]
MIGGSQSGTEGPENRSVSAHYGRIDLVERIITALRAAGKDPEALEAEDLAPVDQLHTRGREATLKLARLAGARSGMRVLDVGGGLGGPARTLASEFGCAVEVLDVTEELCLAGAALTARTGLSHLVRFQHGSALEMPYQEASFDLAWTQHSSMNIADKARLYSEIRRVLKPGGRLALHEIMAGQTCPIRLPVPWAREPGISHLERPERIRTLILASGFRELAWTDETTLAAEWFRKRASRHRESPALSPHLLFGPDFPEMLENQARNLQEGRISILYAIFERQ